MSEVIRYEDAAHHSTTITGWICKTCKQSYPDNNFHIPGRARHHARYCCANNFPCEECGGRNTTKGWTVCKDCRQRHDEAEEKQLWEKTPKVDWDGETPLCLFRGDKYFFDEESIIYYADDCECTPQDLRLTLCEPTKPRAFHPEDYLDECLYEGQEYDQERAAEIKKLVDDWAKEVANGAWICSGVGINPASLPRREDYQEELRSHHE